PARLRQDHGDFRSAPGRVRLGDPTVQHRHLHGAPRAERASVLRAVRARNHCRADPRDKVASARRRGKWAGGMPLSVLALWSQPADPRLDRKMGFVISLTSPLGAKTGSARAIL